MKTILFYIPFIKVGGIERVFISYVNELLERGYAIEVLIDYNMGEGGNTFLPLLPEQVEYKFVKSEFVSRCIYGLRTLGKRCRLINIFLYGFVVVSDFYYYHRTVRRFVRNKEYCHAVSFYQFLPAYITKGVRSKHSIWLHGSVQHFFGGFARLFRYQFEKKLKKYDYVVTVADEMENQLVGIYPDLVNVLRIYNPFDFEAIKEQAEDYGGLTDRERELIGGPYICTVARLDENHKDTFTLIEGYSVLVNKYGVSHRLYVLGDGVDRARLERFTCELGLQDRVLFLGYKTNPYVWIKNSAAFVLSSKTEGFGAVLVEAMALDVFVLASDCPVGPAEVLKNGLCGDLFPTGDYEELARLLYQAINDSAYRANKAVEARKRISVFSKKEVVDEFEGKLIG